MCTSPKQDRPGVSGLAVILAAMLLAAPDVGAAAPAAGDETSALPVLRVGEPQTLTVAVPAASRSPGAVRYSLQPSNDVTILGPRTGTLPWPERRERTLRLTVELSRRHAPGPATIARVTLRWPGGGEETIDVRANVAPLLEGVSRKDLEIDLTPTPRAAAPGGLVTLRYSIFSYEDTVERVRLRLDMHPGWRLVNAGVEPPEIVLEPWEDVEGELHVVVPDDAEIGDRHALKLLAEIAGDEGSIEAIQYVTIARRGTRSAMAALTGTTTVGVSRMGTGLVGARAAGGVALSGKLGARTTVTLAAGRDMIENLTNHRYDLEAVRVSGAFRRGALEVTLGNTINSSGSAITGPFVRGRGTHIRKVTGRFVGDLTLAQPTTYSGEGSGLLARGRAGLNARRGSLGVALSHFSRPAGYTTLPPAIVVLDPDEAERQEFERRLAAGQIRNRVIAGGLEGEFRPRPGHRVSGRVGVMHLASASGISRTAPAAEANYGYAGRFATLNLRWRDAAPSVQGLQVAGDERWGDGTLRIYKDLRLVAQAFSQAHEVAGSGPASGTRAGALGARYVRGAARFELRGRVRESTYSSTTVRRTGTVSIALPVGLFTMNGQAELGESSGPSGSQPLAYYRADVRVTRKAGMASVTMSRNSTGPTTLQRVDVLGSLKVARYELSGGAWTTRGYRTGGNPGAWTTVALPFVSDLTAILGLEYAPLTYAAEPGWRASFALRRALVVPLGFGHASAGWNARRLPRFESLNPAILNP